MTSHRDALLAALIPPSPAGLPGVAAVAPADFWPRFTAAAPAHLRLGVAVAVVALAWALPVALTGRPLRRLPPTRQDAVLARALELPVFVDLVEVVRLVACFAYFEDPGVRAAVEAT